MGVARVTSIPDYGPGGGIDFVPEIYSGKLVEKFYRTTVFGSIASTDYEGEIAGFGSNVVIRTIPDVVVTDYVIGAGLTPQYPQKASRNLAIDKAKAFNVVVSTVDARQSDLDIVDLFANDGSIQLRIAADGDMLEVIPADVAAENTGATAGNDSGDLNMGSVGAPRTVTSDNVIKLFTDMGQVLDEQSVADEGRWAVIPPWLANLIKNSDLKDASISGDSTSIVRNGRLGIIDRFTLYMSRNTLRQGSPTPASHVMFGHSAGLTFAAQIIETQMIDNPNDFGYLVRGLLVYGFEAIAPEYIGDAVVVAG